MKSKVHSSVEEQPISDTNTHGPGRNKHQRRLFKIAFPVTAHGIGLVFGSFNVYVAFQIQTIAYFVGHEPGNPVGTGCSLTAIACLVPFAGSGHINLTSYLLYLQAIIYAVSGVVVLLISGIGDRMRHQRVQYVVLLVIYGSLCLPIAALRKYDLATINAFAGLYVVFNIIGFIAGTYMNAFIPYAMQHTSAATPLVPTGGAITADVAESTSDRSKEDTQADGVGGSKERLGLSVSVWGYNGLYLGQLIPLIIVVGLTYINSVYAGLYMTTACGAVCIVLAVATVQFLPNPIAQPPADGKIFDIFAAIKTLWKGFRQYTEAFKYLVAFTIYNDAFFAFAAVTSQLFNLQVRPTLREFSIFSLVQPITSIVSSIVFLLYYQYLPKKFNFSLVQWTTASYVLTLFVAIWVTIGMSSSSAIGLKNRWEFYFLQVLQSIGNAIAASAFRVVFTQMFPVGKEVQFFGFQLAFSCLTVWIPQVVNGPIVNATNNIRIPAVISAVFFVLSILFSWWTDVAKGMRHAGNA